MFRRSKKENKSKLEHKLYMARETPEPVFDVSDCGIRNVPSGIYSLCRVFLKERLNLDKNNLSSLSGGGNLKDLHLLKVLDLRENSFSNIPDDIELLTNLLELYLNDNQLKKLPNTLCNLKKLRVLEIARNKLKSLPQEMGNLVSLQTLNVLENDDLTELPKSICRAQRLQQLLVSPVGFVYPPADVLQEGAESTMKYICEDVGFAYIPPELVEDSSPSTNDESFCDDHDGFKEQRMQEFLEIERNNELQQRQEFEMAKVQKHNREKLLMDIAQEQSRLDSKLAKVQQMRDTERFRLVEQLFEVEQNTDLAINYLLTLNKEPLAQLLEQEKLEEERLLAATLDSNRTLRRQDVLNCMEELLEQESERFRIYDENRSNVTQSVLEKEIQSIAHVADVLKNKELEKTELVTQLQKDVELQKVVVGALLERSDARSWGLTQQVNLVEAQLAALTQIELDRRKLQLEEHVNDLAEKRANLSMLLMDLLGQQDVRRMELLSTLRNLEQNNDNMQDFWLIQYQRLLDRMPSAMIDAQRNIDPRLSHALLMAGVLQYLPFLAPLTQKLELSQITDGDIESVGIKNEADRGRIADAFHMYTKMHNSPVHPSRPSAPQMEDDEACAPSAPSGDEVTDSASECVVCLDKQCTMVFVPCGHLCCCSGCSTSVTECPLCRSSIEHKIVVFKS